MAFRRLSTEQKRKVEQKLLRLFLTFMSFLKVAHLAEDITAGNEEILLRDIHSSNCYFNAQNWYVNGSGSWNAV